MVGLSLTTAALMMYSDNQSDLESMFLEEIKRRGLDSVDMADIGRDSSGEEPRSTAGSSTTTAAGSSRGSATALCPMRAGCTIGIYYYAAVYSSAQSFCTVLQCASMRVLSTLQRPTSTRMHSSTIRQRVQLSWQFARKVVTSSSIKFVMMCVCDM
jgi:hypothetical protein